MNHSALRIGIALVSVVTGVSVLIVQGTDPRTKKKWIETPWHMDSLRNAPNRLAQWPPKLGNTFPQVELFNHEGKPFSMESMRGKPTLIEFVAMSCQGCQSWSGANTRGGFKGFPWQKELRSIEEYYYKHAGGLRLFNGEVNFVQLVIYNLHLNQPTAANLSAWRKHFGFDRHANAFVVSGGEPLANRDSFYRIPGFMLLDKDLKVRYDALGHKPIHDLYTQLLPAVPAMIAEPLSLNKLAAAPGPTAKEGL